MKTLEAAYNWVWGQAPAWRRYVVMAVLGFTVALLLLCAIGS